MTNKFIRLLIIINGLIIPVFFLILLGIWLIDTIGSEKNEPNSIIVGEKLEDAKRENLALQGITYNYPDELYNSTNFYMPISIMTYEEEKDIRKLASSSNELSDSFFKYCNVLFLDKDYRPISHLLNKKASISDIEVQRPLQFNRDEVDTTVKFIAYLIGFDDSNMDGQLNSDDDHDLYVSDLDGKNLVKVTDNKNIVDFHFVNHNSAVLIRYKDRNGMRDEHNPVRFAQYFIQSNKFCELKDLENKLKEIEEIIIK